MYIKDIDIDSLSPMMQHYVSIKKTYPDCIVMYRLGDFYEMFFEDALDASRILELALTGKSCGLEERAPMCGVPYHSVSNYISKLVESGKKVAIVEQMEDPKEAEGLVKRAVTRIITPGTLTEIAGLDKQKNNYLLALFLHKDFCGLCYGDISTGEINTGDLSFSPKNMVLTIINAISAIDPSEILILKEDANAGQIKDMVESLKASDFFLSYMDVDSKDALSALKNIERHLGPAVRNKMKANLVSAIAASAFLDYIYAFQEEELSHLKNLNFVDFQDYMKINATTRKNLELQYSLYNHEKRGSLYWAMDRTKTSMGARMLHSWIDRPILDPSKINERLDLVEELKESLTVRIPLRECIGRIYDLERLLGKFSFNRGNAKDLLALSLSLEPIPEIKDILLTAGGKLADLSKKIDPLTDIKELIDRAIVEDPPLTVTDGGLIKQGFNPDLDALRSSSENALKALGSYEEEEKEKTGISNLRIIYRKNTGYFIEVTKSNYDKVPDYYRRKQTLKNAERFTTDFLDHQAGKIIGDEQAINNEEYRIFQAIRLYISDRAIRIQDLAHLLGRLDVLASFAQSAADENYCRPNFHDQDVISIKEGRHPVVELMQNIDFIPNDLEIGASNNRIQIITGPNMAGKSTYMRQNALIIIMAQMGSFVPAKSCSLSICDKIFTRIGASDYLAGGQSTFMVEMEEMAEILDNAGDRSFLVLDEVGRGTSTNDGMSIAYAILEYLSDKLKAKTLFATHYHELTILAERDNPIVNMKMDIKEQGGKLLFLRKIVEGKADKSYGIEVAKLSGLKASILERASYILNNLDELNDLSPIDENRDQRDFTDYRISMFMDDLRDVDINQLSPFQAMIKLNEIVDRAKKLDDSEDQY